MLELPIGWARAASVDASRHRVNRMNPITHCKARARLAGIDDIRRTRTGTPDWVRFARLRFRLARRGPEGVVVRRAGVLVELFFEPDQGGGGYFGFVSFFVLAALGEFPVGLV